MQGERISDWLFQLLGTSPTLPTVYSSTQYLAGVYKRSRACHLAASVYLFVTSLQMIV